MDSTTFHKILSLLLRELTSGPTGDAAFILNPSDSGLLRSLDGLSAASASAAPPKGGASIAAHVDHVRYGFELLNRWSRGENPFAEADYAASWSRMNVTEAEWADLRDRLRAEVHAWSAAVSAPRELSEVEAAGVIASVAHLAYHFGAIRQIDRSIAGPRAT